LFGFVSRIRAPRPAKIPVGQRMKSENPKRNQTGFISHGIEGMKQKETGGAAAGFSSPSIRAPRPVKSLSDTR
ncbi:MAG: hypothetical protein J6Z45_06050, partial [Oscillospiraceae bacterium]|nr:hypothetical protein [Oscillospiraceae bacterium]